MKMDLVDEAAEMLDYYERVKKENDYVPDPHLEDSLENFIFYIKGLKNQFLEDLVFNKMQMITDEKVKEGIIESYRDLSKSQYVDVGEV
jgi:hypothetical protein